MSALYLAGREVSAQLDIRDGKPEASWREEGWERRQAGGIGWLGDGGEDQGDESG